MAYTDNGNTTAEHTLLLLHGLFDHKGTWELTEPYLNEHFRTVSVDLVGSGLSSKPQFLSLPSSERYSLDQQTSFVRQFIRTLGLDNLILVGNSVGGLIALRLVCNNSVNLPKLNGLVLISAVGYPQPLPIYTSLITGKPGLLLLNPILQRLLVSSRLAKAIVHATYVRSFYCRNRIPQGSVDRAVDIFAQPGTPYAYRMTARNLVPSDINTFPQKYGTIRLPTLIVWGKEDRIIPALNALRLEADIPFAKLHVFDQCGHAPHLEYPEETAVVVRDWIRYNLE